MPLIPAEKGSVDVATIPICTADDEPKSNHHNAPLALTPKSDHHKAPLTLNPSPSGTVDAAYNLHKAPSTLFFKSKMHRWRCFLYPKGAADAVYHIQKAPSSLFSISKMHGRRCLSYPKGTVVADFFLDTNFCCWFHRWNRYMRSIGANISSVISVDWQSQREIGAHCGSFSV